MSATTALPEDCVAVSAPVEARDDMAAQLWEEHGWSLTGRQTAAVLLVVLLIAGACALLG